MNSVFDQSQDLFNPKGRANRISYIRSISEIDISLFGNAISQAEKEFNIQLEKVKSKSAKLNIKISNSSEDNSWIPKKEELNFYDEIENCFVDQNICTAYLVALSEMKIIYMYKTFEVNVKALIAAAYPDAVTKSYYQWKDMFLFFQSISINLSNIVGYQDVDDLRKVNNCIKHTDLINEEVKKINEFSSLSYFDPESIAAFCSRIEEPIKMFFKGLSDQIIQDLFCFDQDRIDKISGSYSDRMDRETLKRFIGSLDKKYSLKAML